MFDKAQRDTLNKLSLVCFGATSKWQKLLDKGQFNNRETGEKPNYNQLLSGLTEALKFRLLTLMHMQDLTTVIAYEFMTRDTPLNIEFVMADDAEAKTATEELLAKLPEDKQIIFKSKIYDTLKPANNATRFDALQFVSDCVYVQTTENIKEVIDSIYNEYEGRILQAQKRNNLAQA